MTATSPDEGASSAAQSPLNSGPATISIQKPGLHPESVEWDPQTQRFLVSSATQGTISSVTDDGTVTPFADNEMPGTLGTALDPEWNRLLVTGANFAAVTDPSITGEALLASYDLATGDLIFLVDLAPLNPDGRRLANDVTVDPQGNAYVTDSLSPVIYRVTPEGEVTIFTQNDLFANPDGLGLNGIAYHPDGFLLVAMGGHDALYRVPLSEPGQPAKVDLPDEVNGDGLTLQPDGQLIVSAPLRPAILALASNDAWHSAQIVDEEPTAPQDLTTNTTIRNGQIYTVSSHLGEIGNNPPTPSFNLTRINLQP